MTKLFSFAKIHTFLVAVLLVSIAVFSFFISSAIAISVPQYMSYQGQLFDSADEPVNDTVSIEFTLYDALSGGSEVWSETQTVVVDNGYFAVTLGSVNPLDIEWQDQYYITLNIDSDGEMTPRQSVNTSAYAFTADVAYRALADSTAPVSSVTGSLYYNTVSGTLAVYTGSSWINLPTSTTAGAGDVIASANNTLTGNNTFTGTTTLATTTITNGTVTTLSATTANISGAATLSATTTLTGPALLGSYLQFTTNGNNHLYFDNGTTNRISWNDSLDKFEITNDLDVTGTVTSTAVVAGTGTIGALTVTSTVSFPNNSITDAMVSDSITITGYLAASNNLSDVGNTSTARTNLGLGSIATASASDYLQSANNLSDLLSTSTARTNLGVAIGTNVQAYDADLTTFAALSPSGFLIGTGSAWEVQSTSTFRTSLGLGSIATASASEYLQVTNNLSDLASSSTARTNLGLGTIATASAGSYLAVSNNLSDLSSTSTARTNIGFTGGTGITISGAGAIGLTSSNISQFTNDSGYLTSLSGALLIANNLSDLTNTSTARTNLGLGTIATEAAADYLTRADWSATTTDALNEGLSNLYFSDARARAALSSSATGLSFSTSTGAFSLTSGYNIPLTASTTDWQTAFGWGNHASAGYLSSLSGALLIANNLSDLTNTSTARTNLGLGTIATQDANNVALSGGAINGTTIGASTPSTGAFTTLSNTGGLTIGDASGDTVTANAAAWTFTNDTTVALTGGTNGLNFDSNTLSIDATNNRIGIGTAAPVAALDVGGTEGNSYISLTTSGSNRAQIGISGGAGSMASVSGGWGSSLTINSLQTAIQFATENVIRMAIVGNTVGIGDVTPDFTLDVAGTAGFDGNLTFGDASGDTVTANAAAWTFANDTTVALTGGVNGLNFDSNTLSIDATNNRIGIGTAAPSAGLHVLGTTEQLRLGYDVSNYSAFTIDSAGSLTIDPSGTTTTIASVLSVTSVATSSFAGSINLPTGYCFSVNGTCLTAGGGSGTVNSGTSGYLAYYPSTGTTVDDSGVYWSGSAMGIGDATPDDLLNIHSDSAAAGLAITSLGTDTDPYIKFELADGTSSFTMGVDDSDSDKFKISTTGLGTSDRFVIDGSGNVTIGGGTSVFSVGNHYVRGNNLILAGSYGDADTDFVAQIQTNDAVGLGNAMLRMTSYDYLAPFEWWQYDMVADRQDQHQLKMKIYNPYANATIDAMTFYTPTSSLVTRVGVGTTVPSSTLHVLSTSTPQVRIEYDSTNYMDLMMFSDGRFYLAPTDYTKTIIAATNKFDVGEQMIGTPDGDKSVTLSADGGKAFFETFSTDRSEGLVMHGSGVSRAGVVLNVSEFAYEHLPSGNQGGDLVIFNSYSSDAAGLSGDIVFAASSTEVMRIDGTTKNTGFGTAVPSTTLHILDTTEQLRLGYDASNYSAFTIDSAGSLTIDPTGTTTTIASLLSVTSVSTSTFAGSINVPTGYCFAVNGTCLTTGGGSGTVNSGTSGYLSYYPSTGTTVDDSAFIYADNSGLKLGLNTASPSTTLHVVSTTEQFRLGYDGLNYSSFTVSSGGDLTIAPSGSDTSFTGTLATTGNITFGDASGDTVTANAAAWTFANDTTVALTGGVNGLNFDSNTLSIDATNNRIGIGTSAPSYQLHISDGTSVASGLGTTDILTISKNATAPGLNVISSGSSASHRAVFKGVRSRGTTDSPTVPSASDQVLSIMGAIFDGVDSEGTAVIDFTVDGTVSSDVAPQRIGFLTSETTGGARVERFTVDSNGNIGVGDTTPDYLLDVAGTLGIDGALTIGDASADTVTANAAAWTFANDTTVALSGGTNGLNFDSNTLSIDATNDNIGIGTASPSAKLTVYNSGSLLPAIDIADGDVTSANWSTLFTAPAMHANNIARLSSYSGTNGGIVLSGFGASGANSGIVPVNVFGYHGGTTPTTAALALGGWKHDGGTSRTALASSEIVLQMQNGSTVLATLLGGGNFGLGDATPDYLLDVAGTLGIDGALTIGDTSKDTVTANAAAWTFANDTTVALSGGTNGLNFDSDTLSIDATNNRIGIGTAAPANSLHVSNTSAAAGITLGVSSAAGGYTALSMGLSAVSGGYATLQAVSSAGSAFGSIILNGSGGSVGVGTTGPDRKVDILDASAAQLRLTYADGTIYTDVQTNSSGYLVLSPSASRVGINTAPVTTFHVHQASANSQIQITDGTSGSTEADGLEIGTNYSDGSVYVWNNENTALRFGTNGSERLRIDNAGNVGVGTTTPGVKLDVVGTHLSGVGIARFRGDAGNGFISLDSTTSGESGFLISNAGTLIGQFGARASDSAVYIKNRVYGTDDIITLSSSGNVGIGNTAPAVIFHVGTSTVLDGTTLIRTQDANSTCNITADAGALSCGSDITLKKDISTISGGISVISQLHPVTYRWKTEDSSAQLQHGFIAQEVQQVLPHLVREGEWIDGTTRLFLGQEGMIPYIVNAIQEQQLQITALSTSLSDASGITVLNASFDGTLRVKKSVTFGVDTVGQAKILAGSVTSTVTFSEVYEYMPIVAVTPVGSELLAYDFSFVVTDKTATGFTVQISQPQPIDVTFDWHAFASEAGKLFVSDGTTQDIELIVVDEPSEVEVVVGDLGGGSSGDETIPIEEGAVEPPVSEAPAEEVGGETGIPTVEESVVVVEPVVEEIVVPEPEIVSTEPVSSETPAADSAPSEAGETVL